MRVIVLGSSGYTGEVLLRLLLHHPEVSALIAVSTSQCGKKIYLPREAEDASEKCAESEGRYQPLENLDRWNADILFSALPHLHSADAWKDMASSMVIVDLAADMRLRDRALFHQFYGVDPPGMELSNQRVYGLCEIYKDAIRTSDLIANPGCFPTAALIPLIPLAHEGVIRGDIIMNAITGASGAGKNAHSRFLFAERNENCGAYMAGRSHRHVAELIENLPNHDILFTPHLAPLARGIVMTIVTHLRSGATEKDLYYSYHHYYQGCPFARYRPGYLPQSADVRGSNRCDFSWQINDDGTLLIFSAIDNLLKGAAGQAIQNMNIRFGLDETAGLPAHSEL